MKKLKEKAQSKIAIFVMLLIAIGLITSIPSMLIDNSNIKKIDVSSTEKNTASADVQKPKEREQTPANEVEPILTTYQAPNLVELTNMPQVGEPVPKSKQLEVRVTSIQEEKSQTEAIPTTPPKPVPQGEATNKAVKPTYNEQDVKPQESQPKMGDKNDKGQIYVEGFGWIQDNGGGGKGITLGNPGDKLTGNKVGTMD